MDISWKDVIEKLDGGDELTKSHVKHIRRAFPVPSDFNLIWAVAENFGKHPAGLAVTDKGIVIKAHQAAVDESNKASGKKKQRNYIYQIVPWDMFNPEDFEVIVSGTKVNVSYGDTKYSNFENEAIGNFFTQCINEHRIRNEAISKAAAKAMAELHTFGLEDIVFAAGRGADQHLAGHGEFAEKASTFMDNMSGQRAQHVGAGNAKDGPDKNVLIDGKARPIQCKFHKDASSSVRSCFRKNVSTGKMEFRYLSLDGKPMMIEVPKDQYDKAIESMKQRIKNGEVPGVTDPEKAYDIIRQSRLTYKQARNLARAGTFESLTYDVVTGAISCSFVFGITVLVTFGFAYAQNKDIKQSMKVAACAGLQTFGLSFASQILSTQLARTGFSKMLMPASDFVAQKLGPQAVQKIVNSFRALMGKKPIYGAAASGSLSKALRTNAITAGVAFVVCSVPDTFRLARSRMSEGEYFANMTVLVTSMIGGVAGAFGTGIVVGKIAAAKGTVVAPGVGTAIGFVGGMAGGFAASFGTSAIIKQFREDDATILMRMFNAAVMNTCYDHLLDEKEIDAFLKRLSEDKDCAKLLKTTMKNLYSSKTQYADLLELCDTACWPIVTKRKRITSCDEPDDEALTLALVDVMEEIADGEIFNEEGSL